MLTLAVLGTVFAGIVLGFMGLGLGTLSSAGWRLGFPLLLTGVFIQTWWLALFGLALIRPT